MSVAIEAGSQEEDVGGGTEWRQLDGRRDWMIVKLEHARNNWMRGLTA